jgi:hypothetical protein
MRRLKFLLLFLWTLGLLAATLWRYPVPFNNSLGLLQSAACCLAVLAAALALGRAALVRIDLYQGSLVQETVFSLGLGLVGLSLLGSLLGAVGALFTWSAWLLLAGLLILNWEHLEALGRAFQRNLKNKHPWEGSSTEIAILLVLALCAATMLLLALAPPSFYDAMVYHLAQAQRAAQSGRLAPQPAVLFTWLPSLPTPLWALALALDGAPLEQALAPSLLNLAIAGALALALMDASARLLRERRLWLAPALALAQPLLALSFGVFSPDGWMAFFSFLSLDAFLLALDERIARPRDRWLLVSALLCGAACACKPVALVHAVALLCLAAWMALGDASWRRPGLLAGGLGLLLLPLLPWLIQGSLLQGQPFYPFPLRFLGWTLESGGPAAYFDHMQAFGGQGWGAWLRLPYAAFFDSASLGGGGHPGFLLLALAPAALAFQLERPLRWLGAYVLLGLLFWSLGPHVLRYALPLLPGACLLAAQAAVQAEGWAVSVTWTWLWRVLVLAALAAGALQGFEIMAMDFDPLASALGLVDPAVQLARRGVPQLQVERWILAHGGNAQSGVLLLGDARDAWMPARTLAASPFEPHPLAAWVGQCQSPQDLAVLLRRKGYDFVAVNQAEWQRLGQVGAAPVYWPQGDAAAQARFNAWMDLLKASPPADHLDQGGVFVARLR